MHSSSLTEVSKPFHFVYKFYILRSHCYCIKSCTITRSAAGSQRDGRDSTQGERVERNIDSLVHPTSIDIKDVIEYFPWISETIPGQSTLHIASCVVANHQIYAGISYQSTSSLQLRSYHSKGPPQRPPGSTLGKSGLDISRIMPYNTTAIPPRKEVTGQAQLPCKSNEPTVPETRLRASH